MVKLIRDNTLRRDPNVSAMSILKNKNKVKIRPAKVTLRGLRPDPETSDLTVEPAAIIPWIRLNVLAYGHSGLTWSVLDEHDKPLLEDGQRLGLKLKDRGENGVALRAQARSFRQAWRRGELVLNEYRDRSNRAAWPWLFLLLVCAGVFAYGIAALVPNIWPSSPSDPFYIEAIAMALFFMVVITSFLLIFVLPVYWFSYRIRCKMGRLVQLRIDAAGLRRTMDDGCVKFTPWSDLRHGARGLHSAARLQFTSGPDIWPNILSPRMRLALWTAKEELDPAGDAPKRPRVLLRILVYSILAVASAAGVGWFTDRLPPESVNWLKPIHSALIVLACEVGIAAAVLLGTYAAPAIDNRLARRRRRQDRIRRLHGEGSTGREQGQTPGAGGRGGTGLM
ncbi:MAG: NADH-quinone oxidoreductase subunit J [bacterium]|nr:NADH-quinone oxidoreductase subunit J [bacterium]